MLSLRNIFKGLGSEMDTNLDAFYGVSSYRFGQLNSVLTAPSLNFYYCEDSVGIYHSKTDAFYWKVESTTTFLWVSRSSKDFGFRPMACGN